MKKIVCSILISVLLFSLASCDRTYSSSLDILSSNDNASIVVDGKASDSFSFSSDDFNSQPQTRYSYIDFINAEDNHETVKIHKFEIASSANDTYSLSLKLIDANRYVIDFLRVGIVVDGKLSVYKYYDKYETIYHKEDDPDSILHFNARSEVFSEFAVELSAGETKEIVVFIWIEEAELYDKNGNRYTGWADKSYDATPIHLSLEIK